MEQSHKQPPLTTSSVARTLERSENGVRNLERRGILTAQRDSSGRRLFDYAEVQRVKAELNRK